VAPLLHIINFNNLCFCVENETTLISAKNRVDLSSISEVRSYITEWPRFLGPPSSYFSMVCRFSLEILRVHVACISEIPRTFGSYNALIYFAFDWLNCQTPISYLHLCSIVILILL